MPTPTAAAPAALAPTTAALLPDVLSGAALTQGPVPGQVTQWPSSRVCGSPPAMADLNQAWSFTTQMVVESLAGSYWLNHSEPRTPATAVRVFTSKREPGVLYRSVVTVASALPTA